MFTNNLCQQLFLETVGSVFKLEAHLLGVYSDIFTAELEAYLFKLFNSDSPTLPTSTNPAGYVAAVVVLALLSSQSMRGEGTDFRFVELEVGVSEGIWVVGCHSVCFSYPSVFCHFSHFSNSNVKIINMGIAFT